jgi:NAD(P)-dependent dehydrogenase (short-subunit alcohol dehydrogenase family)
LTVSRLDGSFGVGGLSAPACPTSGALAGLAKTAREEWPEVACKALDLARAIQPVEPAAQRIVDEFLTDGPSEVGLSEDGKVRIELVPLPREAVRSRSRSGVIDPGDVVVLSGGARGITAEVAVALAASCQPHLVLLGRTPQPEPEPDWLTSLSDDAEIRRAIRDHAKLNGSPQAINEKLRLIQSQREVRRNLERIQAAGSRVSYYSLDVRNRAEVESVLRTVAGQAGPIRGLIHGAGVLADRRIEDLTDSQFAQVFDTKIEGLASSLAAVDRSALRFLVLFSSSTARFGRVGQVAYAAANELLNKWAQREVRDHPACRTISFNWGPWDGGMVTESLKPMFQREGLGLIPLEDGARLLVEEIHRKGPRPVEIVVLADSSTSATGPEGGDISATDGHSANGQMEVVLDRKIDLGSLPVIRSHVIDGHAVLPMALIMEWLAEGALNRHPGMVVEGVDQLRLYKGVVLRDEQPAVVSVRVGKRERRGAAQIVPVAMHGVLESGREIIHARGEVRIAERHFPGERVLGAPGASPVAIDRDEIYRQVLFHGPAMQAIQQLEGCDNHSIAAWVSTAPPPADWIDRPRRQSWLTDPLAIDAAFQVLVLWTRQRLGANSLPTALGSYRQFRRAFPAEGVRVLAAVRQFSDHRAVADIEFLDSKGQAVARIESYECVIDTSLNQAFRRNHLRDLEVASN